MTQFECLALLLSAVAAVVSLIALVRTRKFQEEQNKLQRITAKLSRKQIDRIEAEEARACKSRIRVTLQPYGSEHRFVIKNEGPARARDIWVTLDVHADDNPLIPGECEEKIPIQFLAPGDEVPLIAAINDGYGRTYTLQARWINGDGSQSEESFFVSV